MVVASADSAHLAVLSSRIHEKWALRAGGWLGVGNDPVYVKTLCFDKFPFPAWTDEQRAELAKAGERLDAFRATRRAEHPAMTITQLYNALEAHRAGKSPNHGMTEDEAADFERGSVVVLAKLHDDIDRLTLDAYGWPHDLSGEALLGRLVDLNLARLAEEATGEVRWLRPDYQRARFSRAKVAGPVAGDLLGEVTMSEAERARWPADARIQVLAIKGALAVAAALSADALAARFKGRKVGNDVHRLLGVLQRDGQVRRGPDGRYALLRAA